jgi:hypothetical protein
MYKGIFFFNVLLDMVQSWNSAVGIVTGYGLETEGSEFESQ